MSGETGKSESGWTTDTLKAYIEAEISAVKEFSESDRKAIREYIAAILGSRIQAQEKFEESVKSRFTQVNEFRASLDDLGKTMYTRREHDAYATALTAQIDAINKDLANLRSRIDVGPVEIRTLQDQYSTAQGVRMGSQVTMGNLIAIIGAVGVIIAIIFRFIQ